MFGRFTLEASFPFPQLLPPWFRQFLDASGYRPLYQLLLKSPQSFPYFSDPRKPSLGDNHPTMGVPVLLATIAAGGSLVTSIKSSWELRRMIKKKQEAKECDEDAPYVFRRLRRAYYDGLMGAAEYEQWYEKFLVAKVEKDCKYSSRSKTDDLQARESMGSLTDFGSGRDAQNPRAH